MDFSTEELIELEEAMKKAELYSMRELINHVKNTGMIYAQSDHPIGYMEINSGKVKTIYVELKEGYEYLSYHDTGGDSFEIYLREKSEKINE